MPLIESGTYTGIASKIGQTFWFDRKQSSLTVTNNDSVNKIVITVSDAERTLYASESYTFSEEFDSFTIKTKTGTAAFVVVSSGSVSEVKAANTNQVAKNGFDILDQKLENRVSDYISKNGQFIYIDRLSTNYTAKTIRTLEDLVIVGKSKYKATNNALSDSWSSGCTISSVATNNLAISVKNGDTEVLTYTCTQNKVLRSIGNVADTMFKDKIIRRIGVIDLSTITFVSGDVAYQHPGGDYIVLRLKSDIYFSDILPIKHWMVQGIGIRVADTDPGVQLSTTQKSLVINFRAANELNGVAGATLLDKVNTYIQTAGIIVTYVKEAETVETLTNTYWFKQASFQGDLNISTSDTDLNPAVVAKFKASRSEIKDYLLNKNGVSYNGQLSCVDKKLVNAKGKKIQLRGIGTHNLLTYADIQTYEGLKTLKYYGLNVLRLTAYTADRTYIKSNPSYIQGVLSLPAETYAQMDKLIGWCKDLDLYCIVDYHNLQGEDIVTTAFINGAKAFFNHFSSKYPNDPTIIYELLNEPWDRSDADIASYCSQVASSILTNSPNAVLFCGAKQYPNSMTTLYNTIQAAVTLSNLFMSKHKYVADDADYNTSITELKNIITSYINAVPLVVSEWGNSTSTGDGITFDATALAWIDKMRKEKVSWCIWKWTNQDMTTSILNPGDEEVLKYGGWVGDTLSYNGKFLLPYFADDNIWDSI